MESLHIDGNVVVTLLGIRANRVRLGIEAPAGIVIHRSELAELTTATERADFKEIEQAAT
jgi:carbon storage regulator CsrA